MAVVEYDLGRDYRADHARQRGALILPASPIDTTNNIRYFLPPLGTLRDEYGEPMSAHDELKVRLEQQGVSFLPHNHAIAVPVPNYEVLDMMSAKLTSLLHPCIDDMFAYVEGEKITDKFPSNAVRTPWTKAMKAAYPGVFEDVCEAPNKYKVANISNTMLSIRFLGDMLLDRGNKELGTSLIVNAVHLDMYVDQHMFKYDESSYTYKNRVVKKVDDSVVEALCTIFGTKEMQQLYIA